MCGKGSQTTTQQSQQTQTPNPQAMAAYQNILGQAQNVAATPYSPFGGQGVAPVNPQQYAGIANINAYQPAFGTAEGMAYNAAQPITAAQIQQYMSPYTQQVVNATEAQFANQNAQQQQQVLGNAVAQGALGGNRVGVAQANLANQQALAQDPVIANLENQGYMTGLNTALTEQQAMAQGAYGVANMAQAGLSGANAQIGAGTLEQQTQQAQDLYNYQQYLAAMGYPFQTTQWLAGIGTGVGSQMGGTTSGYGTTTGPPPNSTAQWLGLGAAGLGAFGQFAGSAAGSAALAALFARGGGVNGYADGGGVAGPQTIPEDHETLRAQQRQLVSGDRHVQMFPHNTTELPVPSGMRRVESHSGVFHYNPKHINPSDIHRHSRNGHEHVLLGLGPHSKHEIMHRIANGEQPLAIVERNEHGHEVRSAIGTHSTVHAQHQHMMRNKSKNHTIHVEHPLKVLSERTRGASNRQSGGGVSNYQLFGGGYGQPMTPYSGGSSFVPGIGLTPGHTMPGAMQLQAPPSSGQPMNQGQIGAMGKNLGNFFTGLENMDQGQGTKLAGLDPSSSGDISQQDEAAMEEGQGVPGDESYDTAYGGGEHRGGAVGVAGYQDGGTPDDTPYQTASLEAGDVGPTGVSGGVPMVTGADQHVMQDVPLPTPKPTIEPATGVAPAVPAPRSMPRGMRNNNPGNIEDGPFARNQPGYTGSDGRFAQFDSMEAGQNATSALLGSYGNKGLNTLSGIINRWAPAADNNDTNAYIRAVSKATGFAPDAPLDMKDPAVLSKVASAIHAHENGLPGGMLPGYMAGDYQRGYGGLDIPPSQRAAARAQAPSGAAPTTGSHDFLGLSPNFWQSVMAAGFGMMASRSPFLGVAVGEGAQQGLTNYQQQRQIQESERLSQARVDNEAQKLQMEADHWQKQYELGLHKQALEETKPQVYNDPILGPRPIFRDPKNPGRWLFGDTGEPVTGAAGGTGAPAPANIPESDDPSRPFKNVGTASSATMVKAQQMGLHGQAMLDATPQPFRNTAEAVANYQAPLSDFTKMGRAGMSMDRALSIVRQINPDYDQNWYSVRGQGYKNFFSSTSGQSALIQSRNFNTATGHAGELAQALHDLNTANPGGVEGLLKAAKDSGTPFLSYLAGAAKKNMATGTPEGEAYAKINAVLPFYAAETEKFYAGGPGSETGRQAVQSPFDTSKSYREVMAALYQQKEMYKSKTAPLEAEYRDLFEGGPGQKEYGTNKKMREWHVARDSATKADEVIDRYAKEAGVSRVGVEPGATPPAATPTAPATPTQPAAPAFTRAQAEGWLAAHPNDPLAAQVRERLKTMP